MARPKFCPHIHFSTKRLTRRYAKIRQASQRAGRRAKLGVSLLDGFDYEKVILYQPIRCAGRWHMEARA